jgi:hypothetical protein
VAHYRGVGDAAALPIEILERARLRLDDAADLRRLMGAVKNRKPKLLILDPLVRLHTADENAAIGGVSKVLEDIRYIQRMCGVSVLVVHHVRKNSRPGDRPGVALRGSSDIHAWGDVNWYLRQRGRSEVTLTIEHRTAASPDPLHLQLVGDDDSLHFDVALDDHVDGGERVTQETVADRVVAVLEREGRGLGFGKLRAKLGTGAGTVSAALKSLASEGRVARVDRVWTLRTVPTGSPGEGAERNGAGGSDAVAVRTDNA